MTINIYRFDDPSAPVLRGVVGDLTTLLDAILVNGYGAKAAAGWAIAFTGTNQRAYRAASGNRMTLAVDDTNPGPSPMGANLARLTSYEAMTAVTVGTKPMPTPAQLSALSFAGVGIPVFKSPSANTTTYPWIAYVSETFIHFASYLYTSVAAGGVYNVLGQSYVGGFMFGDLVNLQKTGDSYATILIGNSSSSPSNAYYGGQIAGSSAASISAHYLQRAYHQANAAIGCLKGAVLRGAGSPPAVIGNESAAPPYPDPITGGMEASEIWVFEQTVSAQQVSARGRIPGLYHPIHQALSLSASFQVGDTITGAGVFAGTSFQMHAPGNSAIALIQTTGTW